MLAFYLQKCLVLLSRPVFWVFHFLGLTKLLPDTKDVSPTSAPSSKSGHEKSDNGSATNGHAANESVANRSVFGSLFHSFKASARLHEGVLNYPIVIIHGFGDRPTLTGIEDVIETILSELNVEYFVPQVQAFGSIFERTKSLVAQIAAHFPQGTTVHLVAHSMGGLNARDIATKLITEDLGFNVKTVTTLGTPHRGGKSFDLVPDLDDDDALAIFFRTVIGTDLGAAGDMSFTAMAKYNETHPPNPDVKYFSWAGQMDIPSPIFTFTYPFTRVYGPTDGLINVDSATWGPDLGPGTHLGTLQGADHASVVGRVTILGSIPHLKAAEHGKTAPVKLLDNTLFASITRTVNGTTDSLLGPFRAVLSSLRLRGSY